MLLSAYFRTGLCINRYFANIISPSIRIIIIPLSISRITACSCADYIFLLGPNSYETRRELKRIGDEPRRPARICAEKSLAVFDMSFYELANPVVIRMST